MSTLIITLAAPGTAEFASGQALAYCLASESQTVSSHGSAAAALMPRAQNTVLLLPNEALAWHRVKLPKLPRSISSQKMRAIIEGLAEEQLLDDTSTLHIASFRHSNDDPALGTWLAVCNKTWLMQQLQIIQDAGHRISRIACLSYPLASNKSPDTNGSTMKVHVSTAAQACITVSDETSVLSAPLTHARAVWPGLTNSDIFVTAEPAVASAAEAILQTKVTVVQSAAYALQATLDARSIGLDLAQGDLAVTGSGRWLLQVGAKARELVSAPSWRAARWGLALGLLVNVVGLNAWAWKESNTLESKRRQSVQILTQTFPQVKVIVDAPVQMQRELAVLRQTSGGLNNRDMENLLARFASLAPSMQPTAINFASGELSLRGSNLTSTQIAELLPQLRSAGLAVRSEGDRSIVYEAPKISSVLIGGTP